MNNTKTSDQVQGPQNEVKYMQKGKEELQRSPDYATCSLYDIDIASSSFI